MSNPWAAGPAVSYNQSLNAPTPFFQWEQYYLPQTFKSLFKYCLQAFLTDSNVSSALENISSYPLTQLIVEGDHSEELKQKWLDILNEMDMVNENMNWGLDYYVYGNAIPGLYIPFKRVVHCPKCHYKHDLSKHKNWDFQNIEFILTCGNPLCKATNVVPMDEKYGLIEDVVKKNAFDEFSVKIWNIFDIEISKHHYTNKRRYTYKIPGEERLKVINCQDKDYLNQVPLDFIRQIKKYHMGRGPCEVEFENKKHVYGIHRPSLSMPNSALLSWGIPVLLCTLRDLFYKNTLRRAQTVILNEHIIPFRMVSPIRNTQQPADFDHGEFKDKVKKNLEEWRRNPTHLMISPVAAEVTQVGGQGKILTLFPEIDNVNHDLIKGLNLPPGFIEGNMPYANSIAALRIVENIMLNYVQHSTKAINWMIKRISEETGLRRVTVKYQKFRMADDPTLRQELYNLYKDRVISKAKLAEQAYDFDPATESKRVAKDQIDQAIDMALAQADGEGYLRRLSEAAQLELPPLMSNLQSPVDQNQIAQAFSQIQQMPPEQAYGTIDQIKQQNPIAGDSLAGLASMSPLNGMKTVMEMQGQPEEIVQQKEQDLQINAPRDFQLYKVFLNMLQQNRFSVNEGPVQVAKPLPNSLPPRRVSA